MPGRSQQSGRGKQDSSKERIGSASLNESARKTTIWPEWTESELAAEKWDLGGGKGRAKSAAMQFEDPEGLLLPPSLLSAGGKVVWKRPNDTAVVSMLGEETPVIVLDPDTLHLDLISSNSHLMHSEFMCWFLSQLTALWQNRHIVAVDTSDVEGGAGEAGVAAVAWRPWEHIQPHPKGTPAPQVNPSGKYCVRLYWMGCWRKVTVDDLLPFLEQPASDATAGGDGTATNADVGNTGETATEVNYVPLYPRTANPVELWPAILTKAVLKIAALDYNGGSEMSELGDCSLIHMLTGWTPLVMPVKTDSLDEVWSSLVDVLPMWKSDDPSATEEQRRKKKCLVLAGFTSVVNKSHSKPLSSTQAQIISASEEALKEVELIPSDYDLHSHPAYPIQLSQVRDEPLVLPPPEPPLPTLQAPYYLGLKHRARAPGEPTPPPTPPPVEPRFVEMVSPFVSKHEVEQDGSTVCEGETQSERTAAGDEAVTEGEGNSIGIQKSCDGDLEGNGNKVWMEYLEFIKGFQMLYIFYCSTNFEFRESYVDLSQTIEGTAQTSSASAQTSKKTASASQLASASKANASPKPQNMLFVDSPKPVTLHLAFASLSNWREGQRNTHTTAQRHSLCPPSYPRPPSTLASTNGGTTEPQNENSGSSREGQAAPEKEYVIAGSLIVETYSWKSIQSGEFVSRLTTTGTKGATIKLPPGRHVFKLHVRTPIGHHLEIFSHSPFVLTDQDDIFTHLNKETSLYLTHGSSLVSTLLSMASSLCSGEQSLEESLQPLVDFYSDISLTRNTVMVILASALQAWTKQAAQYGLTDKMTFAWKAFLYKAFEFLQLQLPAALPRDSSTTSDARKDSVSELRRQLWAAGTEEESKSSAIPDSWADREATEEEDRAARVVQRSIRRHLTLRREQSMVAGTLSNDETLMVLQQSIALIEPSVDELGVLVLRDLFRLSPDLMKTFPFCQDERTRAYSKLYTGIFPPLAPNSWTIVFREVFHIKQPQCVLPLFECPIPSYLFRVIDNDTNSEVPRIFHGTPPCVYQPNSRGYTFQAEAWNYSPDGILTDSSRWSLRLVSTHPELPRMEDEPSSEEVASTFYTKEIVDYCLPDRDGCIFRYFLKASQACPVSVQLCMSKQSALCKLEILDHDIPKAEVRGRGICTLPLYLLESAQEAETEKEEADGTAAHHKYVVCATILRDSWPVSESAWPYISMIKSMEKLEERPGSKPGSAKKGKKEKVGGGKKGTTPQQSSSQLNQVTDKPHWILRVVTKSSDKDILEVKKDTERADTLKSMIQAWEVEQPGRAKKAQESRQKFLDENAIKENTAPSIEEDQSTVAVSVISEGSTTVPQPNTGPVKIIQMDLSPFIIRHEGEVKLLDDDEERARLQDRQKLFKDYRTKRQAVIQIRNADREQRNEAKAKQLEQAEQWQCNLDKLRNKLNAGREAIREKHLAKERARQEAEMAALKAQEELQAAAGRDSKMAKGGKGKGKKK